MMFLSGNTAKYLALEFGSRAIFLSRINLAHAFTSFLGNFPKGFLFFIFVVAKKNLKGKIGSDLCRF